MTDLKKYEPIFCRHIKKLMADFKKNLAILVKNTTDEAALKESHRLVHIFKGGARLMNCQALANLAQMMEDIFARAEIGHLKINSQILKEMKDIDQTILKASADFEKLQAADFQSSMANLEKLTGGK